MGDNSGPKRREKAPRKRLVTARSRILGSLSGRQRNGIAWPMGKLLPSRRFVAGSSGLAKRHYPAVRFLRVIADHRGDFSDVTIEPQARLGVWLFAGFFGPFVHSPP